jgi:plasmid stabilization system protein ParE
VKVVWTEESKESLSNTYHYIFKNSPQNASMVLDELLTIGDSLADAKLEYSKDLIVNDDSVRFVSKWSYKIVYERKEDKVIILDVFNTSQNPKKLFKLLKDKR